MANENTANVTIAVPEATSGLDFVTLDEPVSLVAPVLQSLQDNGFTFVSMVVSQFQARKDILTAERVLIVARVPESE